MTLRRFETHMIRAVVAAVLVLAAVHTSKRITETGDTLSTQTEIPGTRPERDPVGYAGRLESMKGALVEIEVKLGNKRTEQGLIASELLRGDQPDMEPDQLRDLLDTATSVNEMLGDIAKIARGMRSDLKGLLYGIGVRFSPGLIDGTPEQ